MEEDAKPQVARRRTLDDHYLPDPSDPLLAHLVENEGKTQTEAMQLMLVRGRGGPVIEAARSQLGDRLAEARFSDGVGVLLYLLDPTDADREAVAALAQRGGITGQVKVEPFRPEWIATWNQLKAELRRLERLPPHVLLAWPGPDAPYRMPPHQIHLTGLGETIAADWHRRFGADVELRVGARSYPPTDISERATGHQTVGETINPDQFPAVLDGELSIASGSSIAHGLLLINRTGRAVVVHSNGNLTASIVDLSSGQVVGVSSGASRAVLHKTRIEVGQRVRIPVWVGTDSVDPELGYVVPPGEWGLVVPIQLSDGRMLHTPPLPITIT